MIADALAQALIEAVGLLLVTAYILLALAVIAAGILSGSRAIMLRLRRRVA